MEVAYGFNGSSRGPTGGVPLWPSVLRHRGCLGMPVNPSPRRGHPPLTQADLTQADLAQVDLAQVDLAQADLAQPV